MDSRILIWLLPGVLHLLWALRIWRGGLRRRYLALFVYNLVAAAFGICAVVLQPLQVTWNGWKLYTWFWLVARPVTWISFFIVTIELYGRMLEDYPGIRRTGRLFLYGVLGSVIVLVAVVALASPTGPKEPSALNRLIVVWQQGVYLAITAFVFSLYSFRKFFYLNVSPNVDTAFLSLGLYFAGTTLLVVLRGYVGPEFVDTMNLGGWAVSSLCLAVGVLMFSRTRESRPRFAYSPAARTETLRAANQRLQDINNQLARVLTT